MKTKFAFAFAVTMFTATAADAQDLIPVYVISPPTAEFEDAALKQRRDSTKDLIEKLGTKEKTLRLVASAESARVIIEVLDRASQAGDEKVTSTGLFAGLNTRSRVEKVVGVRLTVGTYSTEITGISKEREYKVPSWKGAADSAADAIDKWLKANRERLAVPRP